MNPKQLLSARVQTALRRCGAQGPALVRSAARPEFGDYQANGVMAAARQGGVEPRALAARVSECLEVDDIAEWVRVAGPGFLNIRLRDAFLSAHLDAQAPLVDRAAAPERVVVDYSCPNLAKEMHVGHLRSTIIGDAAARILEALGHEVIRQNHVGDWGTQFGMLLAMLEDTGAGGAIGALSDLESFYRAARARFAEDAKFADASRAMVVALQSGDAAARSRWRQFIDVSLAHCQAIYDRLGASLGPGDVMAESAYNDTLAATVNLLEQRGLLQESDGARCVFPPAFTGKDGRPLPVIVQKSDGGYLYATTDLAAIRHRAEALKADRVLYFTDSRQALHFQQVFAVAEQAGFKPPAMRLQHMPFGAMLGKDNRPFKTRVGGVVKLNDLLDEAEARALRLVRSKSPHLDAGEQAALARALGIGAVKYADLAKNRSSDYVFDWEQMLSFEGNTAPYLLYATARIHSLFRRGGLQRTAVDGRAEPVEAAERDLALVLLRLQEVLDQVAEDGCPHQLCAYLHELAAKFTRFYEQCPILASKGAVRENRLRFAQRTLRTLETGLGLLGIEAVERM